MASLFPGYEYDIFISYRQKDNKYDGWVTEFVDNLKKELEATFKEEISVYFDISPHDGLLETHDVEASLKEKLRCLIFIPIISRTYCDPNSYAWEHEFKAFIEQASKDQFGLKVKLPNGNVTNRVLPVRIHDLDISDYKLGESVLGGVLRGIEFVYKSAGVNRPLRSNEDHPHDNLNNTYYRDQINKVANSIDEIIRSLKKGKISNDNGKDLNAEPVSRVRRSEKIPSLKRVLRMPRWGTRIAIILVIFLILILVYFWPFLFKPRVITKEFESSVAVLEFDDISDVQGYENFAAGATNDLISRLSRIQNLKVVPIIKTLNYKQQGNSVKAICKENEVNMMIQGSVKAEGGNIALTAELIDGEKGIVLWKQSKPDKLEKILAIQDEIATEVARAINTKFSSYQVQKQLGMRLTKNFKAYEQFLKGNAELTKWTYEGLKESLTYYNRALDIDKDFLEARSSSALANLLIAYFF